MTISPPGVGRRQELLARNVARLERDTDLLAPDRIELRVGQRPAPPFGVPIFADLMILELWRIEIGAETATRSCRNAVRSQHADQRQSVRVAAAGDALVRWARGAERAILKRHERSSRFSMERM